MRVLIIGCGTSALAEELYVSKFHTITNVDFSPVCIEQLNEVCPLHPMHAFCVHMHMNMYMHNGIYMPSTSNALPLAISSQLNVDMRLHGASTTCFGEPHTQRYERLGFEKIRNVVQALSCGSSCKSGRVGSPRSLDTLASPAPAAPQAPPPLRHSGSSSHHLTRRAA